MVGAQLASIAKRSEHRVARPGFPYSCVHRAGRARPGGVVRPVRGRHHARAPVRGPGGRRDDALLPLLRYQKASAVDGAKGPLRDARAVRARPVEGMLQRLNPQAAKVMVKTTTSNGRGEPRIFHNMPAGAIRNPLVVTDRSSTAGSRTGWRRACGTGSPRSGRGTGRRPVSGSRRTGRRRGRRVPAATPEKDQEALRYRLGGFSYDEIAQRLGYRNKSGAWKAVERALASGPARRGRGGARAPPPRYDPAGAVHEGTRRGRPRRARHREDHRAALPPVRPVPERGSACPAPPSREKETGPG
jgi:hypothetical protein